jgi:hypothetical protein
MVSTPFEKRLRIQINQILSASQNISQAWHNEIRGILDMRTNTTSSQLARLIAYIAGGLFPWVVMITRP